MITCVINTFTVVWTVVFPITYHKHDMLILKSPWPESMNKFSKTEKKQLCVEGTFVVLKVAFIIWIFGIYMYIYTGWGWKHYPNIGDHNYHTVYWNWMKFCFKVCLHELYETQKQNSNSCIFKDKISELSKGSTFF